MIDWHNCYSEGWQNEIVPEAFSHPAKFARGLIQRIYAHALAQGYLKEGQAVIDPFGGVALGAADALANGLHFMGVELEQNFVDMGGGCDCTGISKADWVACFGRWKRFAHKDGRHWCPRCLAEAGLVLEDWEPALPGMEAPTVSYKRNSGKIPHTEPHRYAGNLDLFAKHARNGATAVLVQGDSRNLIKVLEGARVEGMIASPPYSKSHIGAEDNPYTDVPGGRLGSAKTGHLVGNDNYGTDPAQLGNMPTGEPPSAIVSSPPFSPDQPCASQTQGLEDYHAFTRGDGTKRDHVMRSSGNIADMPTGEPPQAVIGSPPYASVINPHWEGPGSTGERHGRESKTEIAYRSSGIGYGDSDGQLAAMREGDVDAVIASPPWQSSLDRGTVPKEARVRRAHDMGLSADKVSPIDMENIGLRTQPDYGSSDGQLAALPEGEPPQIDGLVASPPFEGSLAGGHHAMAPHDTTGRLRSTYREQIVGEGYLNVAKRKRLPNGTWPRQRKDEEYNNLGINEGNTFWSAARAILLQCYAVLAPGGVAIFVTKRFVRNKQIVEFSQQWADLCQSCGFELIEWIKAWLVEERGTQYDLEGEAHTRTVKRFSFFRRLHAQKYPHLAIEWEDVLIFRKGAA